MFNYFLIILILIINFIFQTTILPNFTIAGVAPNTALILIIIVALLKGKYKGAFIGLAAGLLQDMFFSKIIGINALIFFLIGYIAGMLDNRTFKQGLIVPFITIVISTFSYHIIYYMFMMFLSRDVSFFFMIKNIVFKEAIYNSIIFIFLYNQSIKYSKVTEINFAGRVR